MYNLKCRDITRQNQNPESKQHTLKHDITTHHHK